MLFSARVSTTRVSAPPGRGLIAALPPLIRISSEPHGLLRQRGERENLLRGGSDRLCCPSGGLSGARGPHRSRPPPLRKPRRRQGPRPFTEQKNERWEGMSDGRRAFLAGQNRGITDICAAFPSVRRLPALFYYFEVSHYIWCC